ncbi:MAG: membrane dipeptidase [Anaerolineales bacterium]|nr:membrane dipeptidase [Anaerolineales bacterium]
MQPIIVDAHEDLAWNILTFGRDYTLSAEETRRREQGREAPRRNGATLLGWPDYQRGRVALVFATLFAAPARASMGEWDTQCYRDAGQANRLYRAQLETYYRLAADHPEHFRLVSDRAGLRQVLEPWEQAPEDEHPVGLVLLMEGAEGVLGVGELEDWWRLGVRLIGPAWRATRFCGGTAEPGPLTAEGFALLEAMAELGFILDVSDMAEQAVLQALAVYPGRTVATHANARAVLKSDDFHRHLSDRVLQGLLGRDGVAGAVLLNTFLKAGWKESDGKAAVTLMDVVAHIDHVCQMAGDARHVGLGSDYDGGFGVQSTPTEVDTIADLQRLAQLLEARGYAREDVAAIMAKNWISLLERSLPESV